MAGHLAGSRCPLCGSPCREPWEIPAVHERYPFLTPRQIAMLQQRADDKTAEPAEPEPQRGKRKGENRAHVPGENR